MWGGKEGLEDERERKREAREKKREKKYAKEIQSELCRVLNTFTLTPLSCMSSYSKLFSSKFPARRIWHVLNLIL